MTKLKLHPVNKGKNRWCGPAVVSVVTGLDTDKCAQMFRDVSGRRNITGTSTWEMRKVLQHCGIQSTLKLNFSYEPVKDRPTLTQWLKRFKRWRSHGRVWLLISGEHWQIVSGRRAVCALTQEVVSIKDKRLRRRARVEKVFELQRR